MHRLFRLLGFFLLLPFILSLLLYLLLSIPFFQRQAANQTSQFLTDRTGIQVTVDQLAYQFPFQLTLQGVSCSLPQQLFLNASNVMFSLSLPELLEKRLNFSIDCDNMRLNSPSFESLSVSPSGSLEWLGKDAFYLKIEDRSTNSISLNGDLYCSPLQQLVGNIAMSVTKDLQTISISANLCCDYEKEGILYLDNLSLVGPSIQFNGDLCLSMQDGTWGGNLVADIQDLSFFNPWLSEKIAGRLFAKAHFDRTAALPRNIEVRASKISMKDAFIDTLHFHSGIELPQKNAHFFLNFSGTQKEESYALKTEGYWNFQPESIWIAFSSLKGSLGSMPLELLNTPNISITNGGTQIDRIAIQLNSCLFLEFFDTTLPFSCNRVPMNCSIDFQAPIAVHCSASCEIESFLRSFSHDAPPLSGEVNMLFTLSGTFDKPQISGSGEFRNGRFESPSSGAFLTHLNAQLEATRTHLLVNQLSGQDQYGGTIEGKGSLLLDFEKNFPLSLDLYLEKVRFLNLDYLKASCSGPISIQGNQQMLLSGNLQADEILMTISKKKSGRIDSVEVTYINIPKEAPLPQLLAHPETSLPPRLDLTIQVPGTLSIQGPDLTSKWKGELNIRGDADTVLLFGELKAIEGQYLFNGKPFAIKQGNISFNGEPEKKTTLYVTVTKDLGKVKIDIIFKGNADNPSIALRSNPPLSQREILSWILFNRGATEISPFQGTQLNETITDLDAMPKNEDILTKIRCALGIDRLEISRNEQSENNSVSLQVGKYISDNVLISINKSDVNRLAIEAALTEKVKLQAEIGDDAEGQILLKWKRDY